MKRSKILLIAAAVCALCVLLAACGGKIIYIADSGHFSGKQELFRRSQARASRLCRDALAFFQIRYTSASKSRTISSRLVSCT